MNAPVTTTTDWAERLHARVEANNRNGELFPGYVVRLYDRQAKDPQAPIHDSEHQHGKAGVFATEEEAEDYRDRRLAACVADHEARDLMKAERGPACALLEDERLVQIARWEVEKKALTAKINTAKGEIETLIREATKPETLVECAPRGSGWVVMAAQSLVDGTLGGAPKIVRKSERHGRRPKPLGGAIEQALEDSLGADDQEPEPKAAKPKRMPHRRKGAAAASEPLPPVTDAAGQVLRQGSEVELPGLEPTVKGKITEIGDYDHHAGAWIVLVEGPDGEILRPLATECLRLEPEEQPADQWPDGPEAA